VRLPEAAQHRDFPPRRTTQRLALDQICRWPRSLSTRAPDQQLYGKRAAKYCVNTAVHRSEGSRPSLRLSQNASVHSSKYAGDISAGIAPSSLRAHWRAAVVASSEDRPGAGDCIVSNSTRMEFFFWGDEKQLSPRTRQPLLFLDRMKSVAASCWCSQADRGAR